MWWLKAPLLYFRRLKKSKSASNLPFWNTIKLEEGRMEAFLHLLGLPKYENGTSSHNIIKQGFSR